MWKIKKKIVSDDYDSSGSGINKKGKGLKILTNKQLLNRLLILLAQIQAGNNSKSLKNEIRKYYTHYIGQRY